jgi:prolyl-tRNA synthetase
MVMLHSDDKGLVLPPRVARLQAILIPVGITAKLSQEERQKHASRVDELYANLKKAGVRVQVDDREG